MRCSHEDKSETGDAASTREDKSESRDLARLQIVVKQDGGGEHIPFFQNVDLPHPGWADITSTSIQEPP